MQKDKKIAEELYNIIEDNIKDIVIKLVLKYYHEYRCYDDNFSQIYYSIMNIFVLPKEKQDKLMYEIIKKLENEYYYILSNNNKSNLRVITKL